MAELLSPAGDWDCVRAAVENGADAVYFGLDVGFNARARATNFGLEQLPQVMEFLHARCVKGYVTLNTLVFAEELSTAETYVRVLAEHQVDAVLVQDLGLARLIRSIAPDMALHASTQMTLTSAECIAKVSELGITRVVLPRELSLREIAKVRAGCDLELEAFVHGALCVAYSGQCLTSESLGGRSANRGQCAQACRLPYTLFSDGQKIDLADQQYLLSPQDLAGFDLVPEMLDAGVHGFKIEGRLKSPEYVANITRHYRRALDEALQGRRAEFTRESVREMEMSFSRGFSVGWLRGCDHKMLVPGRSSAKRGSLVGTVDAIHGQRVQVTLTAPVRRGDGVGFDLPSSERPQQGGRIYDIVHRKATVSDANEGDQVELVFAHGAIDVQKIRVGQPVWKTDDPVLNRRLRRTYRSQRPARRVAVDVAVTAEVGQPLRLVAQAASGSRVDVTGNCPLASATRHPVTESLLRDQLGRLGGSIYFLRDVTLQHVGGPMVPMSLLGQARRQLLAQLDAASGSRATRTRERGVSSDPILLNLRAQYGGDDRDQGKNRCGSTTPGLAVLCRTQGQLQAALGNQAICRFYADFQDIREYGPACREARAQGRTLFLATPRIQKPGEFGIFRAMLRHAADGILVRNLAGLDFFTRQGQRVIADYALNAANDLSVDLLRKWGAQYITPSYDLNRDQLMELIRHTSANRLEMVIHQHMPMFHMEHCVFCAVLSPGTNKTNCGRPCDHHVVELEDRVGMRHPLQADVGCRNTLLNAQAQSAAEVVEELIGKGIGCFRVELLRESDEETGRLLDLYVSLLAGRVPGSHVLNQLKAMNRVGVTRGTLEHERNPLAIL